MSFRFNFSCPPNSETLNNLDYISSDELNQTNQNEMHLRHCNFVSVTNLILQNKFEDISLLNIGDLEIKYVLIKSIQVRTDDETFTQIDALQTDLIPGKYEGGLKIWECAVDLALYLTKNECIKSGKSVLELGCGAGLPGIVAYLSGANVTFQDFNSEVLEFVTLPNTLLNTSEDKLLTVPDVCQYLYGDWGAINKKYFSDPASSAKYDVIITSETIYEKSNQKKLLKLMKSALKPEGTIYVAAKIHYFGVGGGVTDFEMLVKDDRTFEITPVKRITEGVERQILMMKFIKTGNEGDQ